MDYSYFTNPSQPSFNFLGLPPTPAQSYEPHDEQLNESSNTYHTPNGFQSYDQPFRFDPNAFVPTQRSPPDSQQRPSLANQPQSDSSNAIHSSADYDAVDLQGGNRSSDDEKEGLTPAQSRRKAQNRAAQRAFRERKERHVKELESKLNSLESHSSTLSNDNERLKRELAKLATQNEILRATSSHPPSSTLRPPSPVPGPQGYSPTDFSAALGIEGNTHVRSVSGNRSNGAGKPGHEAGSPGVSYRIHHSAETGERLLAAGAAWELIQDSEAYRKGRVDVGDVIQRLKGGVTCDGTGPAFREGEIWRAIEESVRVGGDELI